MMYLKKIIILRAKPFAKIFSQRRKMMETDKALWGTVILFAAAFGYPALTIWFAHMKHGLKPDERKNNVGEEAKTG